jgi:dienelactone hydrolase
VCVAGAVRAASFDARVELLFRPPLGEWTALSPDGLRVAYTTRAGGELKIVMMNLEPPGPKRTIAVDPEREATGSPDASPQRLRFMRWASGNRLVFAPVERVLPLPALVGPDGLATPNPDGPAVVAPILAVDADGRQRGTLVDARDFLETSADVRSMADLLRTPKELQSSRNEPVHWRMPHLDILGFLPGERDQLMIGTRGGFNPPALYALDARAGSVRAFGGDRPVVPGERQVFDWFRLKVVGERRDGAQPTTDWKDVELAGVQRELEAKFPRRSVELLDWSETRARILFRVTGGRDPGRIFVFQRTENIVLEILRCAPWLNPAELHETRALEFATSDGARISGYVTWPRETRGSPLPLVVVFPAGFPGPALPAFDPEAEVLADLGFVVARLNHRRADGQKWQGLSSPRTSLDRLAVDDAREAIKVMAARNPGRTFDRQRIATFGRGLGGFLALRALQLEPGVFRSGIAIDSPMDLRRGFPPPDATGAATTAFGAPPSAARNGSAGHPGPVISVLEQAESLTNPVFLLVEPGRNAEIDTATSELRARLQALGRSCGHLEVGTDFGAGRPEARAAVYRKIGDFLNHHLTAPAAGLGAAREVE